jgi:hypothetical protein
VTAPAAPGMLLNPLPRVTIDGVLIATDAAHVATQPVTLAGASVTWGRARAMDQMDPPTAALQVFDPTGTWALGLRPGLPVLLEQHAPLQSGAPVAMFRGRIAGVSVTPRTVGGIDGWQVALTCTSLLLDLANLIPQTAWPAETVAARAARLSIECGSSGGGLSVTFPTITGGASWGTGNVAAVPAGSQVSIWDHLLNLFDSVSTMRLSYLPGPHRFYGLPRRRYDTLRTLARLTRDTTGPRGGAGAYVTTVQTPTDATSPAAVPQFLDGGQVTRPAVGVSRDQGSRLTRARVTYADAAVAGAAAAVEAYVPNVNEIIDGAKVFAQSSIITDAAWAAQQATDLALWANEEQQGWRLPPLSWRVRDGFTTADQAAQFLACGESAGVVFLTGTWQAARGIRPVVGIIGGTVTYTDGAWELDLNPAQVATVRTQHPISWDEIDDGTTGNRLEWHDGEHPNGLHSSVTWDDIRYVGLGLGMPSVPADRGWDVAQ